jgi:hypothetical protein
MIDVYLRLSPTPNQRVDFLLLRVSDSCALDEIATLIEEMKPRFAIVSLVAFYERKGGYRYVESYEWRFGDLGAAHANA